MNEILESLLSPTARLEKGHRKSGLLNCTQKKSFRDKTGRRFVSCYTQLISLESAISDTVPWMWRYHIPGVITEAIPCLSGQ